MAGRFDTAEATDRVTLRIAASTLDDVEETVADVDGYGRCDFIREAVDEKLEAEHE
ncbi:hypothetical protein [Haloarcula sp. JP-L23]|uniref:hypothetical protein n=1 Tax=Haloarcula sp. JP-L23 TaxID=2716717 RepID=UPI00140EC0E5|nr:hypothetical protein G9465_24995 [Haloarcula sp. JP-L23]